jgi:hypothetical protein
VFVHHEDTDQRVDSLFSIARGKALFGCLPRVCNIPRVVDDTEVPRVLWVKCATSAECKTIRIAVSMVMDSWVVLLKLRPDVFTKLECVCRSVDDTKMILELSPMTWHDDEHEMFNPCL